MILIAPDHKHKLFYALSIISGLLLLVIGKDLLHASLRNYSFYISESLLFGSFWLLFIPIVFVVDNRTEKFSRIVTVSLPLLLSLLHLLLFSLIVFLGSNLLFNHTFSFFPTFSQAFFENSISCLLIYGITSLIFLRKEKLSDSIHTSSPISKIKVSFQSKTIILDTDHILCVQSETPYITIVTDQRRYLKKGTLKRFLEIHAGQPFIQIHKSTLINTHHITSYKSRKNGDYDIMLDEQFPVRASRNFSQQFKPYFNSIRSS